MEEKLEIRTNKLLRLNWISDFTYSHYDDNVRRPWMAQCYSNSELVLRVPDSIAGYARYFLHRLKKVIVCDIVCPSEKVVFAKKAN